MTDNPLWDLIQRYMDDPKHRYSPKPADLARETGVSEQVISKWKTKPTLPSVEQLARFSLGTGIGYFELLVAALAGKGYVPMEEEVTIRLAGRAALSDFLEGQASPPSGWAGVRVIGGGTGSPVTTSGGVTIDLSDPDESLSAVANMGEPEGSGEEQ